MTATRNRVSYSALRTSIVQQARRDAPAMRAIANKDYASAARQLRALGGAGSEELARWCDGKATTHQQQQEDRK